MGGWVSGNGGQGGRGREDGRRRDRERDQEGSGGEGKRGREEGAGRGGGKREQTSAQSVVVGVAAGAADAFQCPPPPDVPCGVRGGGTPGDAWTAAEARGAGRVRAEACCT